MWRWAAQLTERHEKKYKIEYSKSFNVFERLLCRKLKIIMRINNARAYFKLARNKNNNMTTDGDDDGDERNDDSQWQKILTIFVYLLSTCEYKIFKATHFNLTQPLPPSSSSLLPLSAMYCLLHVQFTSFILFFFRVLATSAMATRTHKHARQSCARVVASICTQYASTSQCLELRAGIASMPFAVRRIRHERK